MKEDRRINLKEESYKNFRFLLLQEVLGIATRNYGDVFVLREGKEVAIPSTEVMKLRNIFDLYVDDPAIDPEEEDELERKKSRFKSCVERIVGRVVAEATVRYGNYFKIEEGRYAISICNEETLRSIFNVFYEEVEEERR